MPLKRLLGSKKSTSGSPTSDSDALLQINESRDLICKREEYVNRKLASVVAEAIAAKQAGKKDQALACLKRKKQFEEELTGLVQKRCTLDTQEQALQRLNFSQATLAAEWAAAEAIKAKVKEIGTADKVEDKREATEEALEDAFELLNAASQTLRQAGAAGADDDELWAELENMEEEAEQQKLEAQLAALGDNNAACSSASSSMIALPAPPVPHLMSEEDRELAELDVLAAKMQLEMPRPMPMMGAPALVGSA